MTPTQTIGVCRVITLLLPPQSATLPMERELAETSSQADGVLKRLKNELKNIVSERKLSSIPGIRGTKPKPGLLRLPNGRLRDLIIIATPHKKRIRYCLDHNFSLTCHTSHALRLWHLFQDESNYFNCCDNHAKVMLATVTRSKQWITTGDNSANHKQFCAPVDNEA